MHTGQRTSCALPKAGDNAIHTQGLISKGNSRTSDGLVCRSNPSNNLLQCWAMSPVTGCSNQTPHGPTNDRCHSSTDPLGQLGACRSFQHVPNTQRPDAAGPDRTHSELLNLHKDQQQTWRRTSRRASTNKEGSMTTGAKVTDSDGQGLPDYRPSCTAEHSTPHPCDAALP